jgi:hypothetical protein
LIGNFCRYLKHFFQIRLYRKYKINYLQIRAGSQRLSIATEVFDLLHKFTTGLKTMELAQLILAYLFDVVFYGFSTLFIFDFLWGLNALIQKEFETPVIQSTQSIQLQSIPINSMLADPWDLPLERSHQAQKEVLPVPAIVSKASKKNAQMQPTAEAQAEKLTFEQVCIEFAEKGLALERHRSGHYCYRVVFGCESPPRFKRLQEALDWLSVSFADKSQPEESLLLVE